VKPFNQVNKVKGARDAISNGPVAKPFGERHCERSEAISAGNEIATSAAGLLAMTKWDILDFGNRSKVKNIPNAQCTFSSCKHFRTLLLSGQDQPQLVLQIVLLSASLIAHNSRLLCCSDHDQLVS